ncbi:hypothetical protein [Cryobacterium tagatosivorans]|uniref:Uncharacterized protein n=1 Tax=Cryobacterium tagatosivorans TaxID=1259199 RepID=A0A4R8UBZ3_9MICO|nr:hypothetical protein [Cryobacterium tagatosivorans]TFB48743.1 hypothetical protein E3O23_13090 [Cryobacterium tagatosivorans]
MTDVPLDAPARHTVLRSFAGHLEADPDAAFARLAGSLAAGDEAAGHVRADPERRLVVVEGDWWYRGEYRVLPEESGALVQYEVINSARFARWAARWAARPVLEAAPAAFGRLLTAIQAEVDDEA